jgi:hypothetical protein
MASPADSNSAESKTDAPVTLFRVMQAMIGEGLKERYKPPQKLSHELFVLLLQMKEQERHQKSRVVSPAA